jgi:glutaredoxin 3
LEATAVGGERFSTLDSIMAAQVTIYTRQWCGYCTAAERLLRGKGIEFENIDCTGDRAKRAWLAEVTGRTTVPQIFIDGRAIGGYDDMRTLDRSGELDKLLAGAKQSPVPSGSG